MDLKLNILNIIFLISSVINLLMAIYIVVKQRTTPSILLGIILLVNGFLSLNIFLADSRLLFINTWLIFIPLNFLLAIGPSLYFYTKFMISKQFRFKIVHFIFYFPVLIEFVYYLILFTFTPEVKMEFLYKYHDIIISPIEQAIGIIYTLVFLIISLEQLVKYERCINNNYSNTENITLNWLKRLLVSYSVIWILWIIISFVDYFFYNWGLGNQFYYPIYIVFFIISLLVSISAFNKKHSILFIEKEFIPYKNEEINILNDENLELIYKLRQLMGKDKIYLDPNLKIGTLAEQINIPSHKLSNLLNSGLKKSFYEFVNYYRVEHVKKMLLDKNNNNLTILAIAYESGFNSKSTFNDIFKKITKMTPKEYKKANI